MGQQVVRIDAEPHAAWPSKCQPVQVENPGQRQAEGKRQAEGQPLRGTGLVSL